MQSAVMAFANAMPPETGFVIMAFKFGEVGAISYGSNVEREDAMRVLHSFLSREKLPNESGGAQ